MPRLLALLPCALLPAAACLAQAAPSPAARTLVLAHVNVVPMDRDTILRDRTVVVRGGRIVSIRMAAEAPPVRGARVVDGRGRYLVPGLWDMHVHVLPADGHHTVETFFPLLLAHGVTGVRDMGGSLDSLLAVRRRIAERHVLAPRIYAAGPLLDGPRQRWSPAAAWSLASADEARRAVDSLHAAGVDFLKVYTFLPREAYFAIAEQAKRRGMRFAGHVPGSVGADEASDAGQASLEHSALEIVAPCVDGAGERLRDLYAAWSREGFAAFYTRALAFRRAEDPARCRALFARFRRNGTWVVPTLVFETLRAGREEGLGLEYVDSATRGSCRRTMESVRQAPDSLRRAYFAAALADLARMHRARVGILAGTDLPNPCVVPGTSLHAELEMLVRAGLTPYQALRAATAGAARFMGAGSLGTVAVGRAADLVLLEADPLADVRNTRRIAGVVRGGRWLSRAELDAMLARVKAMQSSAPSTEGGSR